MGAGTTCLDALERLHGLQLHVGLTTDGATDCATPAEWIDSAALISPETLNEPLEALLARFAAVGYGSNRRAVAASLLLRFGWAAGFAIAAYLVTDRVPVLTDYALKFSPRGLLHQVWIRDAVVMGLPRDPLAEATDWMDAAPAAISPDYDERARLRECLMASLLDFSEPLVATYHRWSGFSRHALWSMVVSSWGAQFTSIARQLGDADRGISEARALFALTPEIARAAPQLYEVRVDDAARTCQRRAACCLWFKSPGRPFCASCPILSQEERLQRNRNYVRMERLELPPGGGQATRTPANRSLPV